MPFIASFIYGTLAAGAALLSEGIILAGLSSGPALFILGACIEESLKLLFLIQWQRRFPLRTPLHLLAAGCLGAGFAGIEVWLAAPPAPSIALALALVHTTTSVVLGYGTRSGGLSTLLRGSVLLAAIVLHTVYNLFFASLQ
ncbi:MAG: hypothetical protein KA731_03265 [Candidatus Moranbacteria bacterium]|nr:hypothetical protein [Candidatus Moranbacteria bacterium]